MATYLINTICDNWLLLLRPVSMALGLYKKNLNGFISNPLIALDTEFEILGEVIKKIINNNLKLAIKSDRGKHLPIQDLKA